MQRVVMLSQELHQQLLKKKIVEEQSKNSPLILGETQDRSYIFFHIYLFIHSFIYLVIHLFLFNMSECFACMDVYHIMPSVQGHQIPWNQSGCESHMGAQNWTLVLYKSGQCSYYWAISPAPKVSYIVKERKPLSLTPIVFSECLHWVLFPYCLLYKRSLAP